MAALSAKQPLSRRLSVEASEGPHRRAARLAQLRRLLPSSPMRRARADRAAVGREWREPRRSVAAVAAARDLKRSPAPGRNRLHEAGHRPLQHRRTIAQVGRLADRRVDHRIERNDAPQEVASKRSKLVKIGAGGHKTIGEPIHDRRRQGSEFRREFSPRVAEIGQGQHDARAHDADANLERAIDGQDDDAAGIARVPTGPRTSLAIIAAV